MKSSLKAKLEAAINTFLEESVDNFDRPKGLAEHMTNAAEAVYDATFSASKYTMLEANN